MTATIARLVLAMLLLPATGAVFLLSFVALVPLAGPPTVAQLVLVWAIVYGFVAIYWVLLWHGLVRWTSSRIAQTAGATGIALVIGGAIGLACSAINGRLPTGICVLIGGGTVPITWVLATVVLWRESPSERARRLATLGATVVCPICGYNLAGLRETRCPECGASFTLDQLAAAQPRAAAESAEL